MWRTIAVLALATGCGGTAAAASDAAALDAEPFRCSSATCDDVSQYCYVVLAGAAPAVGCNDLPASCSATPTCDCVLAAIPPQACGGALGALSCHADGVRVTVACNLP